MDLKSSRSTAEAEIVCRQVLHKDYSVFSAQWTVFPADYAGPVTATFLLERYLAHIRGATGSLVRPHRTADGIEFRLAATRLPLLTFAGPSMAANGESKSATLKLSGGLLVAPESCRRGELTFSCEPIGKEVRASLKLSDYCPLLLGRRPGLLRRWLYRLTQAAIHRLVTVRFLIRLHRELAGKRISCRVAKISHPGDLEI